MTYSTWLLKPWPTDAQVDSEQLRPLARPLAGYPTRTVLHLQAWCLTHGQHVQISFWAQKTR